MRRIRAKCGLIFHDWRLMIMTGIRTKFNDVVFEVNSFCPDENFVEFSIIYVNPRLEIIIFIQAFLNTFTCGNGPCIPI